VRRARPDAVFVGTFLLTESARLLKELRAGLPRRTRLLVPDGFTPFGLVDMVGAAAEGMTASVAGLPVERLPSRGGSFVSELRKSIVGGPVVAGSVAAVQATEVLLDAISRSDGTRASVVRELFRTRVSNGILGSFRFDRNGDTTAGRITFYRIVKGTPAIFRVITPSASLVR
jgi:branched-chain amino acid transport system substrate-binding protein